MGIIKSFLAYGYRFCKQALHIDFVRYLISQVRYFYFCIIKRKLKLFYKEDYSSDTIARTSDETTLSHNLNAYRGKGYGFGQAFNAFSVPRSNRLIRPLMGVDRISQNCGNLKVLTIGPRTEGEIFNLVAYGFKLKNITGLDLHSYSPYIKLGDIHDMPFNADSFDVVICGWVLPYSNDKAKACSEMARVLKPNGVIAIGATYRPHTDSFTEEPINKVDDILKLFPESVIGNVYFSYDQSKENKDEPGGVISVFSANGVYAN